MQNTSSGQTLIFKSKTLCLATCISFTAALFVAQVHRAVVAHGYCSDHGKVIHLSLKAARLPGKDASSPGLHKHRHITGVHGCLAQVFLLSSWVRPRNSWYSLAAQATTGVGTSRCDVAPSLIPLLHQAPKLSPPRG